MGRSRLERLQEKAESATFDLAREKVMEDQRKRKDRDALCYRIGAAVVGAVAGGDLPLGERMERLCADYFSRPGDRKFFRFDANGKSEVFAELMEKGEAAREARDEKKAASRAAKSTRVVSPNPTPATPPAVPAAAASKPVNFTAEASSRPS